VAGTATTGIELPRVRTGAQPRDPAGTAEPRKALEPRERAQPQRHRQQSPGAEQRARHHQRTHQQLLQQQIHALPLSLVLMRRRRA
jgi:hypothetical protein